MDNQNSNTLFNKDAWKAIILAVLVVTLVGGILSWQYRRMTEESEERISSLEDVIERGFAQNMLDKFMTARIKKNETQANIFLTERAMEQKIQGKFILIDNFNSYIIFKSEKLEKNKFRFIVKIYKDNIMSEIVEVIALIKILDGYYIDSVEIAG